MSDPHKKTSLLEELDKRQDQVLADLDRLNSQIEQLLNDCVPARRVDNAAANV
jgi:hypothetical protein